MNEEKRVFQAIIWTQEAGKAGERTTVLADNLDDAERQIKRKYGSDIVFSVFDEKDADRPR